MSLRPKSMNSGAPPKIILSAGRSPYQRRKRKTWQIGHLVAATEKTAEQPKKPCPAAASPRHGNTNQICETSWRTKQGKQDRSTDRADAQHVMIFSPDINPARPNSTNTALPSCVVT